MQTVTALPTGSGNSANALLILFDQLYITRTKIQSGATAPAAVLAAMTDAEVAIMQALGDPDAMITVDANGNPIWDFNGKAAYVKASSTLGQQMIADANILQAFNSW